MSIKRRWPLHQALYCCLAFLSSQAIADESIALITQVDHKYSSESGRYEIALHALVRLSNITVDGVKVSELSGLAWDADEGLLYALSDNGLLLHLRPEASGNTLTDVQLVTGHALKNTAGKALRYKESDSEDLTIRQGNNRIKGDTRLVVSFERIPRLNEYLPDGTQTANILLPGILADIKNYRSENKSMEAVTTHDRYGIITGPELPLIGHEDGMLELYALDGQHWTFPAQNTYYGALVGLTAMPDGSVLALERAFGGLIPSLEISLHRIVLDDNQADSEKIYTFKTDNGILNDNFEGITRYHDNTYFMISDDNNHPLKRTTLVYFSINEKP